MAYAPARRQVFLLVAQLSHSVGAKLAVGTMRVPSIAAVMALAFVIPWWAFDGLGTN
jgi:hypothetical protein